MKHDERPMSDDPAQSAHLRRLLRAGRSAGSDYDLERGLARHLANLQSGAPLPAWAIGDELVKVGGSSLLSWLGVPLVGAALVGGWFALHGAFAPQPVLRSAAPQAVQVARLETAVAPRVGMATDHNGADGAGDAPTVGVREPREIPEIEPTPADVHVEHHAVASATIPPHTLRAGSRSGHAPNTSSALHPRAHTHDAMRHREGEAATPGLAAEGGGSNYGAGLAAQAAVGHANAGESTVSSLATPALAANAIDAPQPAAEPAAQAAAEPSRAHADAAEPVKAGRVVTADSRLEREMQMLAVAQRVLNDDPDRALRMARQGEREFPGSMFSAERKQLALLALVQLGRVDEARRSGLPFLRTYPNAPWSARLRQALATGHLPTP
jgi:hypothetical protein